MKSTKMVWFPDFDNVVITKSALYNAPIAFRYQALLFFHSLFVGLTAPLINLPFLLWHLVLVPLAEGAVRIVMFFWVCWSAGLTGRILTVHPQRSKN